MGSSFEERLEDYLRKNGIEEIPSNKKEVLKLLNKIVYESKVDIDYTDMLHSNNNDKLNDEEYVRAIRNLEINLTNAQYYLSNVRGIIKEEKRLKRKEAIKKLFKK